MSQHDLETIEVSMDEAKKAIKLAEAMERLTRNRDFKAIMLDGYFEKEAVRLVLLKSAPAMQSAEQQAGILREMDAIGSVRQYFNKIMVMGEQYEKALVDYEAAREEILAEDAA